MDGNSRNGQICCSFSLSTNAGMVALMWHDKSQNSLVRRVQLDWRGLMRQLACTQGTYTDHFKCFNVFGFPDVISKWLHAQDSHYFVICHNISTSLIRPTRYILTGGQATPSTGIAMYFRKVLHVSVLPPDVKLGLPTCSGWGGASAAFPVPSGRSVSICELTNNARANDVNVLSNLSSGRGRPVLKIVTN